MSQSAPAPGQVIRGKYELVRRLADGGMGSVWVARHRDLEIDVAIKFRRQEDSPDARAEERFKREARAAAGLTSPHVVHIHDYGIDAGRPYIAMELLVGEDLEDYLDRRGPLDPRRALEISKQVAKGLAVAHDAGIVHRDIKPQNLFLTRAGPDEIVKLLDFGIVKDAATEAPSSATSIGTVLGSPGYMSPEQARGGSIDVRSDVWSLCAVLYRMLTGRPPFEGANAHDIAIKICTEDAPKPSDLVSHVSAALDAFFERGLARDPDERFASAQDLVTAFEQAVAEQPAGEPGGAQEASSKIARGPSTTMDAPAAAGAKAEKKGRDSATQSMAGPAVTPEDASNKPKGAPDKGAPSNDTPAHDAPSNDAPANETWSSRLGTLALAVGAGLVLLFWFWSSSERHRPATATSGSDTERSPNTKLDTSPPHDDIALPDTIHASPASVPTSAEQKPAAPGPPASSESARKTAEPASSPSPSAQQERAHTASLGATSKARSSSPAAGHRSASGHKKAHPSSPAADTAAPGPSPTDSAKPASAPVDPIFGLPVGSKEQR